MCDGRWWIAWNEETNDDEDIYHSQQGEQDIVQISCSAQIDHVRRINFPVTIFKVLLVAAWKNAEHHFSVIHWPIASLWLFLIGEAYRDQIIAVSPPCIIIIPAVNLNRIAFYFNLSIVNLLR